jgi:MFS family permease
VTASAPPPVLPADPPPAGTERVLAALVADGALREPLLGDLAEEYAARCARDGRAGARRWYRAQALRSAPHLVAACWWPGRAARRRRLASLLAAVAVGYAAVLLLHQVAQLAAGLLLAHAGVGPAAAGWAFAACSIAAAAGCAAVGGAVAARALPDAPLAGALALAAAAVALAAAGVVVNRGVTPLWYWGGVQLLAVPLGVCAGGLLRVHARAGRRGPSDARGARPT